MNAVVWHGNEDVRVDEVPDPAIQKPTKVVLRLRSRCRAET
jgi:threonine dehydrogenase-like Zn-dependent dehydrogenase